MNKFAKIFDSEVAGQILVIRDYCDIEEKEVVKFCVSIDGTVQELIAKNTFASKADELFEKVNLHHAEKAVKPLVDAFKDLVEESI